MTTCELLTTAAGPLISADFSPVDLTNADPGECLYANENRSSVVDLIIVETYSGDQLPADSVNPFPQNKSSAVLTDETQVADVAALGPDAFHATRTSTMSTKLGVIFQSDLVEWVSCGRLLKLGTTGEFTESQLESAALVLSQKAC